MILTFLRSISLFAGLDETRLSVLGEMAEERRYDADAVIFRHGDAADGLYLVREGQVAIVLDTVGKPVQLLAKLGPGDFFGEAGLLDDLPRSASARALAPTVLAVLPRGPLIELLSGQPLLRLQLRRAAIERHGANVHATVSGASTRREVRVRVDREVQVWLPDGRSSRCRLDNLSLGGLALKPAPDTWKERDTVAFGLGLPGGEPLLHLEGEVSWRRGDKVGVTFLPPRSGTASSQKVRISRAIQELLAQRRS